MHHKVDLQVHSSIDLTFEHINLTDPNELHCYGFIMASTFFDCDGSPSVYSFICKYVYHIITYETLLSLLTKEDFWKLEIIVPPHWLFMPQLVLQSHF